MAHVDSVTLRKDGKITTYTLDTLTDEFYNDNKDYFFCSNTECDAKMMLASGPKRRFFKSYSVIVDGEKIIERHIDGCPYGVPHDKDGRPRKRYDKNLFMEVSDEHLIRALKRASKLEENPDAEIRENGDNSKSKTRSRSSRKGDNEELLAGTPITSGEGDGKKEKEPPLRRRSIDDITEKDIGTERIVTGSLESVDISSNSTKLVLVSRTGKRANVYFSEAYKAEYGIQYEQIKYYKRFLKENEKVNMACGGQLIRDDKNIISVVILRPNGVMLNGKTHYQVINQYITQRFK